MNGLFPQLTFPSEVFPALTWQGNVDVVLVGEIAQSEWGVRVSPQFYEVEAEIQEPVPLVLPNFCATASNVCYDALMSDGRMVIAASPVASLPLTSAYAVEAEQMSFTAHTEPEMLEVN